MVQGTILVTGAGGFVGQHLLPYLQASFPATKIVGTGLTPGMHEVLDITNRDAVEGVISRFQPDFCVHLAGIAAVGTARADPRRAWDVNLHGTLNLADAISAVAPHCRLIFISSADCYGTSFKPGLPLDETALLAPINLYGATKAAAELALGAMAGEGLRLLRLRPFNHTGPGQTEDFVIPAFASQIARIEAGLAPPEIAVGALDPERDFLDIRDVCNAYKMCIEKFDYIPNNLVINIASGRAVKIATLVDTLLGMAKCQILVRQDQSRLRPVDIPRTIGNPSAARLLLEWEPHLKIEQTLESVLYYARRRYLN
jgi:GDP-4-dehydro-6-deoxy-D-mannose reductase